METIEEFPDFEISDKGIARKKLCKTISKIGKNNVVALIADGKYKGRSISKLMRIYFPPEADNIEEWKEVKDHSNYHISSLGRIKNIEHHNILGPTDCKGYLKVYIPNDDGEYKTMFIHMMVIKAFIEKIEGKTIINHKNGIKHDNKVENLEWTDRNENSQHAVDNGFTKITKMVQQIDSKTDEVIAEFASLTLAAKSVNGNRKIISSVCRGNLDTHKGYKWKYNKESSEDSDESSEDNSDDEKEELWLPIKDFSYEVSSLGRVRKQITTKNGAKTIILRPRFSSGIKPRASVGLVKKKGEAQGQFLVHRLVAETFLPNPKNLPQVDHIDSNPKNNRLNNLRWVSGQENVEAYNGRKVVQMDLEGNEIKIWNTIKKAKNETNSGHISDVLGGRCNTSGGYRWKYYEEELEE